MHLVLIGWLYVALMMAVVETRDMESVTPKDRSVGLTPALGELNQSSDFIEDGVINIVTFDPVDDRVNMARARIGNMARREVAVSIERLLATPNRGGA